MGNLTDTNVGLGSINLGNGLIEIAALTSLIGSAAAESLALGDKGPGGLAWAMMTVFGVLSVVKLFIAATVSGWLCEAVGVRSSRSDAVVGLSLNLDKSFRSRGRGELAKAVECEIQPNFTGGKMKDSSIELERREVYVFDQRTTSIMSAISPSAPGKL